MRKVQVQIEKRYVISFNGNELPGRFKEINQMAGMRLLQDEKGKQIVLDFPPDSDISELLASVLGDGETMDASIVKASPDLVAELKSVKKENTDAGRTDAGHDGAVETEERQTIDIGELADNNSGVGDSGELPKGDADVRPVIGRQAGSEHPTANVPGRSRRT